MFSEIQTGRMLLSVTIQLNSTPMANKSHKRESKAVIFVIEPPG